MEKVINLKSKRMKKIEEAYEESLPWYEKHECALCGKPFKRGELVYTVDNRLTCEDCTRCEYDNFDELLGIEYTKRRKKFHS